MKWSSPVASMEIIPERHADSSPEAADGDSGPGVLLEAVGKLQAQERRTPECLAPLQHAEKRGAPDAEAIQGSGIDTIARPASAAKVFSSCIGSLRQRPKLLFALAHMRICTEMNPAHKARKVFLSSMLYCSLSLPFAGHTCIAGTLHSI